MFFQSISEGRGKQLVAFYLLRRGCLLCGAEVEGTRLGHTEVLHISKANDFWVMWDSRLGILTGISGVGVWV